MELCRACLASDKEMVFFNETLVNNYNLLTNLDVMLSDDLSQYLCKACEEIVDNFLMFRTKCAVSESTLSALVKKVKHEEGICDLKDIISPLKEEIKDELVGDEPFLENCFELDIDSLVKNENLIPVLKQKRATRKKLKVETKKTKEKKTTPKKLKIEQAKIKNDFSPSEIPCGLCDNFVLEEGLKIHLETHIKRGECLLCKQVFKRWPQLLAHRFTHIPIKYWQCHICKKKFRSFYYMEYHYINVHFEGQAYNMECKLCNHTFDDPLHLRKHVLNVHSSKTFQCHHCLKMFKTKCLIKMHMKAHMDLKKYVCDVCGFSCNYPSGLKDHNLRKHVVDRILCKDCGRPFVNQQMYDRHKCYTKVDTKLCPICGIQVEDKKGKMKRHLRSHKVGAYKCYLCPAVYANRTSLRTHIDKHSGNRTKQCEFCPAKFYSASVLIKHRRVHTGEKPYVCKVCNKGFTGNHNLKVHMKVHGEYLVVKRNKKEDDAISFAV